MFVWVRERERKEKKREEAEERQEEEREFSAIMTNYYVKKAIFIYSPPQVFP